MTADRHAPNRRGATGALAMTERARAYELSQSAARRRSFGIHYTPADVADEIVGLALDGLAGAPLVCDPSCGGGAFLLAAGRALEARGLDRRNIVERLLWGADLDPGAVAVAAAELRSWAGADPADHLVVGDTLVAGADVWGGSAPRFDAVVGNPPFQSQLGTTTVRDPSVAAALIARFGADVLQPYTDTAALFLLVACELATPCGRVALIQPQSVLAGRDTAAVRRAIDERAAVIALWTDGGRRRFDAAVSTCAPILQLGGGGERPHWSALLAEAKGVPMVEAATNGTLGDIATAAAGFRDEYYGLVGHVHEAADLRGGAPLVTAGLIDVGRCHWGSRPVRFAKQRWEAPVVALETVRENAAAARWIDRQRGPKVAVATQTRVIEAAVDIDGSWVASVPVIAVSAERDRLWEVAAALCAPATTAWAASRVAGAALSSDALKLSAAAVLDVPLPADSEAWSEGAERLRDGDLPGFGIAMGAAYGVDDAALLAWWTSRLP